MIKIDFKVGDRVRCINILDEPCLTLNKTYKIMNLYYRDNKSYFVGIVDDDRDFDLFVNTQFIKVDFLKNKIRKLKELLKKITIY